MGVELLGQPDEWNELVKTFDELGGTVVQPMALKHGLEARGMPTDMAAELIAQAFKAGVIESTEAGGFRLARR